MNNCKKISGPIETTKMFNGRTGVVDKRVEISFVFEAIDSNPNGDPDSSNSPRVDPVTGEGLVTGECLKSKIRQYLLDTGKASLLLYRGIPSVESALAQADKSKKKNCDFYDVRAFGAVLVSSKKEVANQGVYRGAAQFSLAKSVGPVRIEDCTVTRSYVTKEGEDKTRTMGHRQRVPYGLYVSRVWVNPMDAKRNGFSWEDLELLVEALRGAFAFDKSSARPNVRPVQMVTFVHESYLGDCTDRATLDKATPRLKDTSKAFSESLEDFNIEPDLSDVPASVEVVVWDAR